VRERDIVPAGLPDDEHQDVFTRFILPTATKGAVRQQRPVVVFIAGQPGSGKDAIAALVHEVLNRRGGAMRVSSDLYKAAHRHYCCVPQGGCGLSGVGGARWWGGPYYVSAFVRASGT
jgi:hypothetical protein